MENIFPFVAVAGLLVAYYILAIWLRSDLIKIRMMGVKTAPNIIPIAFFIIASKISDFLGGSIAWLTYRLFGFSPIAGGYYGNLSIGFRFIIGPVLSLVVAGLIYYAYRSYLLRRVRPDNPPLAALPAINGVLFWIAITIPLLSSLYIYFLASIW